MNTLARSGGSPPTPPSPQPRFAPPRLVEPAPEALEPAPAVVAPRGGLDVLGRSRGRRVALAAGVLAVYPVFFLSLVSHVGPGLGAAGALPVMAVAWLLGATAGVGAGLLVGPLQMLVLQPAGTPPLGALLHPGTLSATAVLVLTGLAVGRFRALSERFRGELAARDGAERALRESEERYALAARGANDGLWDWDVRSDALYLSPRGKSMLGYAHGERIHTLTEWVNSIHPEDAERVKDEVLAHLSGQTPQLWMEYRLRHRDGGYVWVLARGVAVRDEGGQAYRMAGSLTDVSEQKRAEEQLRHQALHDALTGLPNRALFLERLQQALARGRRGGSTFAVLFLDLDRFKLVNDSLGHLVGDELLRAAAQVVRGQLRTEDTIARLGGDEFAILLEDLRGADDAMAAAARLERALRVPFQLGGQEVFTSASIGLVLGSEAYARPEELLRDADAAMYRAKALGRACVQLFTTSLHASAKESLQLDAAMRRGLERDEFVVHYQPLVSLPGGRIVGLEALVRWQHPERGLVPPGAFIPVAEETGLIVPLGERVLREACRQVHAWRQLRPDAPPLQLCVNLSARQLAHAGLVDGIAALLAETGLPASQLKLEVTESMVIEDVERTGQVLSQLRALGLSLSMDDFGTGYSSLSFLHQFPLQTLKVDRSFVGRLTEARRSCEIVRTIIGLAHSLGLDVVAEGVETPAQLAALREMGCQSVQGYLFARPLDAAHAEALLREDPRW